LDIMLVCVRWYIAYAHRRAGPGRNAPTSPNSETLKPSRRLPVSHLTIISPARSSIAVACQRPGTLIYAAPLPSDRRHPVQPSYPIHALAERLHSRGNANMTIVAAAMRKLLTLAYEALKSGRAFDQAWGLYSVPFFAETAEEIRIGPKRCRPLAG
jgi:hypothetical protein